MNLLETIEAVREKYEECPLRKSGKSAFSHPASVAMRLWKKYHDEDLAIVGILHDCLEDGMMSEEELYHNFGERIFLAVSAISRREGEKYYLHILRALNDPYARRTKMADNMENLSDGLAKHPWRYRLSFLVLFLYDIPLMCSEIFFSFILYGSRFFHDVVGVKC